MYFLWNYLTWIYFGGDAVWSTWYAWFLGHNLDLWMLVASTGRFAVALRKQTS